MSKPTPPAPSARAVFRRKVALSLHLFFQGCVVVGSQGPWWDVFLHGERLLRQSGYDGDRAPPMEPLALLAAAAALVAFFFTSYDLASRSDLQAPILVASLVALIPAAVLFHRVKVDVDTVQEVTAEVLAAPGVVGPDGEVAPVGSASSAEADPMRRLMPTLKFGWGLALMIAAAPLMVVVSLYLTFVNERAPESST